MSFLSRLLSGLGLPQRDSIRLVGDELTYQGVVGGSHLWRFPDGDPVGIQFFDRPPDLPRVPDLNAFAEASRALCAAGGGTQIECDIVPVEGIRAVRQIIKLPQEPSGMAYSGGFILPWAGFSYVLKVVCPEHGMTGIRETVLLTDAWAGMSPDQGSTFPEGWNPDAEEHDSRFPDHPVSRMRRHLRSMLSWCRVDKALLMHPRFPLP